MAGDWIKIEKSLMDKPEIEQIAALTGLSIWDVCGRLMAVWSWADSQTEDGDLVGVHPATIDRIIHHPGFAHAMAKTKPLPWLLIDEHGITFPAFERHNGKSAKRRAQTMSRVQSHRANKRWCNADSVTDALHERYQRREEL